jgi:hypothetical protein
MAMIAANTVIPDFIDVPPCPAASVAKRLPQNKAIPIIGS